MRRLDLNKSQSGPTLDALPRRRRDAWRPSQARATRFPQPALHARRGIPRRGAR
ncbi:hypothetical protein [Streptomyces montanus]|uniref:hypothetical protein n=1 Tax=Streptomyces montanus TaxID=2580423 RepID=UPI0014864D08|nr:hypothetical protein [Streptomyces montanus]